MSGHLAPSGSYRIATMAGDLVLTAGITPRENGVLVGVGRVGAEIDPDEGRRLTGVAAVRALAAAESALVPGRRIDGVAAMTVYVNAAAGFTALSAIADAASDAVLRRFPDAPLPVRTTVGVSELPDGAPVEIQLTCTTIREAV